MPYISSEMLLLFAMAMPSLCLLHINSSLLAAFTPSNLSNNNLPTYTTSGRTIHLTPGVNIMICMSLGSSTQTERMCPNLQTLHLTGFSGTGFPMLIRSILQGMSQMELVEDDD
jgi:hypothetical protein